MAAFKQHLMFSCALGAGYSVALRYANLEPTHALLAGGLCGVSGMLPDLDSDSGRPVRELFGLLAAVVPLLLLHRLQNAGFTSEGMILLMAALYLAIRFGLAWIFQLLTVHRGMFHSIPAALIAAEIAFLAHDASEPDGRLALAGGVFLGFLSHLVLDELSSVDVSGMRVHLNKAAGSALKLFSRNWPATAFVWLVLAALSYGVATEQGLLRSLPLPIRAMHAGGMTNRH
jgi:hypothetical protein